MPYCKKLIPLAQVDIGRTDDAHQGSGRRNHEIAESVAKVECQYARLPRDSQDIAQREKNWHNDRRLTTSGGDEAIDQTVQDIQDRRLKH